MGVNACRYLGNSSNNLIAIGQEAGYMAGYTSSSNYGQAWTHSIAIGYRAMYNATGAPDSVVAIGSQALKEQNGGGDNTSGGYILEKPASEIKISNIIFAVDEEVKTLNCKKNSKRGCNNKSTKCITHNLWDQLDHHINSFFEKVKLQDLTKVNQK